MCKNLLKGLLGGNAPEATASAAPVTNVSTSDSNADVKNTDVVAATAGQEASGRVKLGVPKRATGGVAGLSL